MSVAISFGQWLRSSRKALDLTQEELADLVGCSPETIRKYEADRRRPSRQVSALLAAHLEIPPEERPAFLRAARAERADERATTPELPAVPEPGAAFPALASLPAPATTLIGRAQDVAAVCQRLQEPGVRLLTLIGPPGIGKTRLALQVADELAARQLDAVWFVALAPISDPRLVGSAIARTLGVREAADRPLAEILAAFLRDKRALLVLDNFEQVLPAAPLVGQLLADAPRLRVLVTSRAPLRLYGEHELPVPPLALPELERLPPLDSLAAYAAVALFVERARAVKPDFALTDANARAVAEICVRLDGLPLAIELAAARRKLFAPEVLLERLGRRLVLLTGGPQDLPTRQQTLRGAIDWSFHLLETPGQALFARLGVFVGGCTVAAAEAVCDPTGSLGIGLLEGLAALVDQSLLRPLEGVGGEPRFGMLETIREYALDRLLAVGDAEAALERHASYFLTLAETAEPRLRGPEQIQWLVRLETEHDNLRAALGWAVDRRRAELGARIAAALWRFWQAHGDLTEGRRWLDQVLELNPPVALRARVLNGAGVLALNQSDYARARARLDESLRLCGELGDRAGAAWAQSNLGWVAHDQGEYERSAELFERSLDLRRELGDTWGLAWVLNNLGMVALERGDHARASDHFSESLAHFRAIGDTRGTAQALSNLGWVLQEQGEYARATPLLEESLDLFRALKERRGIANSLSNLGLVAHRRGEPTRARTLYLEGLRLFRELGEPRGIAECLEGLGAGLATGGAEAAAQLFGAAEALREAVGAPLSPAERTAQQRLVAAARSRMGPTAFAAAWAAGRALSLDQAVERAVSQPAPEERPAASGGPLSRREHEVALLIARGLSNRQIAAELVIAEGTVAIHVTSILRKLDCTTRAQVAAWMARQGALTERPGSAAAEPGRDPLSGPGCDP